MNSIDLDSNIHNNAKNKLVFWDEVNDYPFMSVVAGGENRQYLPGSFKWGFLQVIIRIYVEDEEPQVVLENFLADVETLLDANNNLVYDSETGEATELISILSLDTDQGLHAPIGVGEMIVQIQYDL
jgi:hypothetical protein